MQRHLRLAIWTLLLAVLAGPAFAAEEYGRAYSLHTLDYRVAETLIWELCGAVGDDEARCQVQSASPHSLSVVAPQEVHAQIVQMLAARDEREPASLDFEIVLVRLVENGGKSGHGLPASQERALEAVYELFPGKRAEIVDSGLLRTVSEGQIRLSSDEHGVFEILLRRRGTVAGSEGLELTVDLDVRAAGSDGESRLLSSRLSLAEGETVVAGSSRITGQPPIVVLLTSKMR